jgi:hypothetical protein
MIHFFENQSSNFWYTVKAKFQLDISKLNGFFADSHKIENPSWRIFLLSPRRYGNLLEY